MIHIQFLIGFVVYLIMAWTTYYLPFKETKFFFPAGIAFAIIANFIWLSIARATPEASVLLMRGLYWDVMLTSCYLLVPFVLFGAKVALLQALGIALIILGIILTKLG